MKIGEFAKLCGTKITVLRHYDKEKLLMPENTDKFSGYRYYSSEQILTFHRITALKNARFSLQEIKDILSSEKTKDEITEIFSQKEKEFLSALENLKEAKLIMTKLNSEFSNGSAVIKLTPDSSAVDLCALAEAEIKAADYQRISQYRIGEEEITCDVIKLGEEIDPPEEELPFENDEEVIGKWEIIGIYAVKEIEFFKNGSCRCVYEDDVFEGDDTVVWTKNYLLRKWNWSACEYEIRTVDEEDYLIIEWKSGDYRYGGYDTNYYVFTRG